MANKNRRAFEDRVGGFYHKCEWFALRTVVFGVFLYELGKFVGSMLR